MHQARAHVLWLVERKRMAEVEVWELVQARLRPRRSQSEIHRFVS